VEGLKALAAFLAFALAAASPPEERPYPFFRSALRDADHAAEEIRVERGLMLAARDRIRLSTDLYLPPGDGPWPTIVMRTPYGKEASGPLLRALARYGYAVVAQDCRGTGASEPGQWDMYMYEKEDGHDLVDWVRAQRWSDGKIGGTGGSYVGETQWFMASHPGMTAILPEVAGIGDARSPGVRLHMLVSAYARTIGKSGGRAKADVPIDVMERQMEAETLRTGYYNDRLDPPYPERVLERFPELRPLSPDARAERMLRMWAGLPPAERTALVRFLLDAPEVNYANLSDVPGIFGPDGGGPAFKYVAPSLADVYGSLQAPPLMLNGWYDWGLDLTFETWALLQRHAPPHVRDNAFLVVTPGAHNDLGYREGADRVPALRHRYRGLDNVELIVRWYDRWLKGRTDALAGMSRVTYYLMGANEWRGADAWPPAGARPTRFFLDSAGSANGAAGSGVLRREQMPSGPPDRFVYDPDNPPPTRGGSIVSTLMASGSADQSDVQSRRDVLVYTSPVLDRDLEVTGPVTAVVHASSSAADTDFTAKLTDVFPDGRALVLQSGIVRARFREPGSAPSLLKPGRVYPFEIDLWSTANLFRKGHRIRLQLASADFPRYERNANRGGRPGKPIPATQTVFHDRKRPSHLLLHVMEPR
jgi:predicted acyl esterase